MVRILTGADAGVRSTLVMPADSELRTLAKSVYAVHPFLDTRAELGDQHDLHFRRTFWAIGWLGRLTEPERKNVRATSWWTSYCSELLRDHRVEHEVEGRMFAATALAHGDVPHTIIPGRWPFDCAWGFTYPHAGASAGDAWTRVLATGALRPASPLPYEIRSLEVRRDVPQASTIYAGLIGSAER